MTEHSVTAGARAPVDPLLAEREVFGPGVSLAHRLAGRGGHEVEASGSWIVMSDRRRVLDLGSYGTTLLGHRHPAVVAAAQAQLDRLPVSSRSLANDVAPRMARLLIDECTPSEISRCWFGLNGTDVVDIALKLARLTTRRSTILAATRGFHGKSLGALSATAAPEFRGPFEEFLAPAVHVDPTDLALVERVTDRGDVAAMILEPVLGEGGVRQIPPDTVVAWGEMAARCGAHLILDEVQCGFFRCGPFSLGLDAGARPSALLLGKSLGGGVAPLSAMLATDSLYQPLLDNPFLHSSTFSGFPLACAAGLAALDTAHKLEGRRRRIAADAELALRALQSAWPQVILGVEGQGLLWGITTVSHSFSGALLLELAAQDVVVSPCLSSPTTIRLFLPAILTDGDMADGVRRLHSAVSRAVEWSARDSTTRPTTHQAGSFNAARSA